MSKEYVLWKTEEMMMLTKFGKELRRIRIEKSELLKDMADRLGVTSSYLSAVEHGKRDIPQNWIDRIVSLYSLGNQEKKCLIEAAKLSILSVKINLKGKPDSTTELVNAFARKLNSFSEEDVDKMMKLIDSVGRRGKN